METVFISIHDLSKDARILWCSRSIEFVLGYEPDEVKSKSCWDYFHPDEMPFAKEIHNRTLNLDKAATFSYARVKHKNGDWIGCECVFTVVYDVLIASTAIYQHGAKSQRRAIDGANIRRVFSSSPRDPRYHMLSFISDKFAQPAKAHLREPRAALILNRYSRTSPIIFATSGVQQVLGISSKELIKKSFYFCIEENCLTQAVRTLESAKANDSIAYLRFTYRDPTQAEALPIQDSESESDGETGGAPVDEFHSHTGAGANLSSSAADGNGPRISEHATHVNGVTANEQKTEIRHDSSGGSSDNTPKDESEEPSRASSGNSTDLGSNSRQAIFGSPGQESQSSRSSSNASDDRTGRPREPLEIEAVISCTSDGLVVVLRKAKPVVPANATTEQPTYPNGLFASPWAERPVLPDNLQRATSIPNIAYPPVIEPTEAGLMAAIREVAVFAWSLTGINGSLIEHSRGIPRGEAIPPGGLPVWDPNAPPGQNDKHNGFSGSTHRRVDSMERPTSKRSRADDEVTSSDDEILWKRVPTMPPIQNPKRRAYHDAFDSDTDTREVLDGDGGHMNGRRRRKLDDGVSQ